MHAEWIKCLGHVFISAPLINSFITIPAIFLQITTISIFAWMYFVLSKSLRSAFLFEDRVASITTVTFLLVLTLFSDPIRIFV